MEYIQSDHDATGCFLCQKQDQEDEPALVLARSERAFVVLNAYPYNPGHVLVAPTRHVGEMEDLDEPELGSLSGLLRECLRAMKAGIGPDGFNVGMNLGRVAGAGVPDHLHWHVVPRWNGDTNYMAIVGRTRVLPELLADTYAKLKPHFTTAR